MTHPIERASVEQARTLLADACDANGAGGDFVRNGHGNLWVDPALVAIQQARDAGFAEGLRRAAEVVNYGIERAERDWRNPDKQDAVKQVCTETAEVLKYLSAEANEGRCDEH